MFPETWGQGVGSWEGIRVGGFQWGCAAPSRRAGDGMGFRVTCLGEIDEASVEERQHGGQQYREVAQPRVESKRRKY